jgi:alanyl-tRNA synthetase
MSKMPPKITTNEIRDVFLDFFKSKRHTVVASDSLVPAKDPTLLFTGAGMNQFKDYFLGVRKDMKRATSSQKCLRTGDLDNVGRTPYHHSFFEMLGNFSFGDYFKEEAIAWAIELLTGSLKIPRERLRVSVHCDDEEAFRIWRDKIKVPERWIAKLGDDTNFWPANAREQGPNGPCGPCSEIFFDQGEGSMKCGNPRCDVDCSCGRFAEIWNLVFTQYDRKEGGVLTPLAAKNIDTGAGLERFACVLQGKKNNFEIDILEPLVQFTHKPLGGPPLSELDAAIVVARTVADHVRAATFTIADGALPSNEGRGYVVRKLIRRAVWRGRRFLFLNQKPQPFLYRMAEKVTELMEKPYPYLRRELPHVQTVLKGEEERFLQTIEEGQKLLDAMIRGVKKSGARTIPAEDAFKLYDTYGFPDDLTVSIAKGEGLEVDLRGFEKLMEEQRRRAKDASKIADSIFVATEVNPDLARQPESIFRGYETLETQSEVLFLDLAEDGGWALLRETPFYAEQGGQVGDRGVWEWEGGRALVLDTQWKDKWILHRLEIEHGNLHVGRKVRAVVDERLRERTRRHHTATHLLQAALRSLLGTHVRQLGSLVNPDKLRFDFSHPKALSVDEIKAIENFVNSAILKNLTVCAEEKGFEESQKEGSLSFFGEKYAERVRVLNVGSGLSKELCGGTHVSRTGDIGSFLITSESSIASGVRRIEAVAGEVAVEYAQKLKGEFERLAQALKSSPNDIFDRVERLQARLKDLEKKKVQATVNQNDIENLAHAAVGVSDVQLICHSFKDVGLDALRGVTDRLRQRVPGRLVAVLFSEVDGMLSFVAASTAGNVHAGELAKKIAGFVEGSGGGKKDFAQGGGRRPDLVPKAKDKILSLVEEFLKASC